MDLDLVFLGTSGSMPTAQRAPAALLLRRSGERLLFDCGEGTQRQLLRSSVGLIDLREIFLTHYHADHYLGLPGMLKTFALRGREVPITIYGPPGLRDLFDALRRIFGKLTYTVELKELRPGDELIREDYRLVPFAVAHGVSAVGYALVEDARPGTVRRAGRRCSRRARRPGAWSASARRVGHAPGRADDHAGQGARRGAPRTQGRDRRRRKPVRVGDRGRARGGRARARGDVLRGRARSGSRDAALDRARGGRASLGPRRSSCSR